MSGAVLKHFFSSLFLWHQIQYVVIVTSSVSQKSYSLFQSKFYRKCELVFLLQFPVSCNFIKFIQQLLKYFSSSCLLFCPSFNNMLQKPVPMQVVANLVSLHSLYCMQDISFLLDSLKYLVFQTIRQVDVGAQSCSFTRHLQNLCGTISLDATQNMRIYL